MPRLLKRENWKRRSRIKRPGIHYSGEPEREYGSERRRKIGYGTGKIATVTISRSCWRNKPECQNVIPTKGA
jgi:hypothetical protein